MEDSRRVIDYSELWNAASTSSTAKPTQNGNSHTKQKASPSKLTNGGWTADGVPQTASTARKLRKILALIEGGEVNRAESELSNLGPAKNNYEVQRALALAKTGGPSVGHGEEDEEEYDDEEYNEEDFGEEAEVNGAEFDWQGAMTSNGKDAGRQLTHAEIWDDSALVDAWNAAEEEYKLFHAQRSAHEKGEHTKNGAKRTSDEEYDPGPPKKRSALWHDSPAKGSQVALAAKSAQEQADKVTAELAERKKQAKALLARVAGDEVTVQSVDGVVTAPPAAEPTKQKKLKGTTPPSSSISGNLAWHSACATVSRTPNAIGKEVDATTAATIFDHHPTSVPSAAPTTDQGEDIFQNLAMAWYYAGYYQAMATKWSSESKSQ